MKRIFRLSVFALALSICIQGSITYQGNVMGSNNYQTKVWNNGRTNLKVDGDLDVAGELNKGRFAQIDSIASAVGQITTEGFLGNLYVRGTLYQQLGQQWTGPITNPFTTLIRSIAYGDGVFVAVGALGKIARSTDSGATWGALIANPFGAGVGIVNVAYGGGVFIAVGSAGTIARSTDLGLTWGALIVNPFNPANFIRKVAYGNGVFVAVGDLGQIAVSNDLGVTWGSLISNPFGGDNIWGVAFGYGVFVATTSSGKISRSLDLGVTWSALISNPFAGGVIDNVTFGNGVFLAAGDGTLSRSIDYGVTWSALITNPFGVNRIYQTSYVFGMFQASSANGLTARSFDNGVTWSGLIQNPFGTITIYGMAASSSTLVAIGDSGSIATASWNAAFSSAPEQLYTPTFTGFGTVSNINFSWRQVANRIVVMGKFKAGVTVASEARISLPFVMISDAALIPNIQVCGVAITNFVNSGIYGYYCLIESGTSYITLGLSSSVDSPFTKIDAFLFPNGTVISVQFEVPISGLNV